VILRLTQQGQTFFGEDADRNDLYIIMNPWKDLFRSENQELLLLDLHEMGLKAKPISTPSDASVRCLDITLWQASKNL